MCNLREKAHLRRLHPTGNADNPVPRYILLDSIDSMLARVRDQAVEES